jgi:cytochrome c biogenesis protein CcdA
MQEWIRHALSPAQMSFAVFPAVFMLGLLGAATSCCTLPLLGAVAGYAGTNVVAARGRRELLAIGLSFMLGTILSLALLGALMGFAGRVAGASMGRYARFAGGFLMVLFGLAGMGILPFRLPRIRLGPRAIGSGAVVYGFAVGGASTACSVGCNPLLAIVVSAVVLKGATLSGAGIFAVFALGYSVAPAAGLVGIGLGLGRLGANAGRWVRAVNLCAGALLIITGFYLLRTI